MRPSMPRRQLISTPIPDRPTPRPRLTPREAILNDSALDLPPEASTDAVRLAARGLCCKLIATYVDNETLAHSTALGGKGRPALDPEIMTEVQEAVRCKFGQRIKSPSLFAAVWSSCCDAISSKCRNIRAKRRNDNLFKDNE